MKDLEKSEIYSHFSWRSSIVYPFYIHTIKMYCCNLHCVTAKSVLLQFMLSRCKICFVTIYAVLHVFLQWIHLHQVRISQPLFFLSLLSPAKNGLVIFCQLVIITFLATHHLHALVYLLMMENKPLKMMMKNKSLKMMMIAASDDDDAGDKDDDDTCGWQAW